MVCYIRWHFNEGGGVWERESVKHTQVRACSVAASVCNTCLHFFLFISTNAYLYSNILMELPLVLPHMCLPARPLCESLNFKSVGQPMVQSAGLHLLQSPKWSCRRQMGAVLCCMDVCMVLVCVVLCAHKHAIVASVQLETSVNCISYSPLFSQCVLYRQMGESL